MNAYIVSDDKKTISKICTSLNVNFSPTPKDADVIIFPDENREINEAFYGRIPSRGESTKIMRDAYLFREYMMATYEYSLPIIGFGSSANLLSMANGAETMVLQSKRQREFNVYTFAATVKTANDSIQLMHPFNMEMEDFGVLAYAEPDNNQTVYWSGYELDQQIREIEMLYYKYSNTLCIQTPFYLYSSLEGYSKFSLSIINTLLNSPSEIKRFYINTIR